MRRIVKIAVRFLHTKRLCVTERTRRAVLLSMPHAALCVSRRTTRVTKQLDAFVFQCRTQHCVCRDKLYDGGRVAKVPVSMPHAALCVSRRCVPQPLCGAGCTVLERRNGGMRLCARAGALSISFSSYLKIAHASFFFNDVFCVDAERSVKNILYLLKFYFICIIVLV